MLQKNDIIAGISSGDYRAENELITFCTDIAEAYLRTKYQQNSMLFTLMSARLRDVATDCIAEMFEKKGGRLVVLEKYFGADLHDQSPGVIHSSLRRLVFSKVNEHLFNSYRSFDPSLAKLIRNAKRVLNAQKVAGLRYDPVTRMIAVSGSIGVTKPQMATELLAMRFSSKAMGVKNMTDALRTLRDLMSDEQEYASTVHIVAFCTTIRSYFIAIQPQDEPFSMQNHMELRRSELQSIIADEVDKASAQLYSSYVASEKMSPEVFAKYFMVAKRIITTEYLDTEEEHYSYYDHFCEIFGQLDKESYRGEHRTYLEYFVKCARNMLIPVVKREYSATLRYGKE